MTLQELYESVGGSYDSAKRVMQMERLIAKFIVKFPDDPSAGKLFAAWDARDVFAAFEGAHALKGVCANLGLDALSARSSELCERLRSGAAETLDDPECARRMAELRAEYARTAEAIRAFAAQQ